MLGDSYPMKSLLKVPDFYQNDLPYITLQNYGARSGS